jgi:hypothetical protein
MVLLNHGYKTADCQKAVGIPTKIGIVGRLKPED